MTIISVEDERCCGDGTKIMVATRRYAGNESPSMSSSSVTTRYVPGGKRPSTPVSAHARVKTTESLRERVIILRTARRGAAADNPRCRKGGEFRRRRNAARRPQGRRRADAPAAAPRWQSEWPP